MKTPKIRRALPAFTLVELTVVISVMLSLVSVLTTSARAWKRGADRSDCLIAMRNFQVALRSYQNLYGYNAGTFHPASNDMTDIAQILYRRDLVTAVQYEKATGQIQCKSGGTYSRGEPGRFPLPGVLYMSCNLTTEPENHVPDVTEDW